MRRCWSLSSVVLVTLGMLWEIPAGAGPRLIDDGAALMTPRQRLRLAEYHAYLLKDHDIDYRVVTAKTVPDINLYAVERFEKRAVGGRSKTGRGLLLVIDPVRDLIRLEVSYSLEGVYPDAFIAYIEHRQMAPFFRVDRVADGILAATEIIITRAQRAKTNAGFEGEAWIAGSGGAGATAIARLGAGTDNRFHRRPAAKSSGRTPKETLGLYLNAMGDRNANPDAAMYTPATRRMLRRWVMTPAQMDNVVKTYRRCHDEPARVDHGGRLAVIRYRVTERQCAPWFFKKIGGTWALDLTTMQKAIRFGRQNAWHFDPGAKHPYVFAFEDWRLDSRGYPRARR